MHSEERRTFAGIFMLLWVAVVCGIILFVLSGCGSQVAIGNDIDQVQYVEESHVSTDSIGIIVGGAVFIVFISFVMWCMSQMFEQQGPTL